MQLLSSYTLNLNCWFTLFYCIFNKSRYYQLCSKGNPFIQRPRHLERLVRVAYLKIPTTKIRSSILQLKSLMKLVLSIYFSRIFFSNNFSLFPILRVLHTTNFQPRLLDIGVSGTNHTTNRVLP